MDNQTYIMNQANLEVLFTLVLQGINDQINARIKQTTEGATTDSVVSAKVVADEIKSLQDTISGLTHIKIDTYVGELEDMPKDSSVIYLQKDDEDDPTWEMYVTVGEEHLSIGPCTVDLTNCWKKDEVEEMKTALGLDNKLEASDLEGYLTEDDIQPMTTEQITESFNKVFNQA